MQFGFLNIEIISENEYLTMFKLKGEITSDIYPDLVSFCKEKVEKTDSIFDFEDVHYISSGGMAALLIFKQIADQTNKRFIIFGLQSNVKKVIELTKLTNLFNIVETEENAKHLLK